MHETNRYCNNVFVSGLKALFERFSVLESILGSTDLVSMTGTRHLGSLDPFQRYPKRKWDLLEVVKAVEQEDGNFALSAHCWVC